jgi:hypothetical protein
MDMNHAGKSEDPTFNSLSVAIGEAVCAIVEGTIATVQHVVSVIAVGGRHSLKCKSREHGQRSLSLGSHTASMNSPDKSCEQSTKVFTDIQRACFGTEINDETLTVGGNSRNGGEVQPLYRRGKASKL